MQADELTRLADTLRAAAADAGICVTITLPTHRHAPDNEQDPISLRGLVAEARQGVEAWGLERAHRQGIERQLDRLERVVAERVGWNRTDLGLACYLTPTDTTVVSLEHAPPRRAISGRTFHMASVIADVPAVDAVAVIVLSSGGGDTEGARLYRLADGAIEQLGDDMSFEPPDLGPPPRLAHKGTAVERRRVEDFMRRFDDHVTETLGADHDRRIVLVGIRRLRDKWRAAARRVHVEAVIAEVEGNHDRTSEAELVSVVTGAVDAAARRRILERIAALDGLPTARLAINTDDIAASAESGNLAELYVEEGATEPVMVDGVMVDDRIAAIVRAAWDVRADIVIAPPDSLDRYDTIVGVRRFTR